MPPSPDELITVKRCLRQIGNSSRYATTTQPGGGPRWWILLADRCFYNILRAYTLYTLNIFVSIKIFQRLISRGFVSDDLPG